MISGIWMKGAICRVAVVPCDLRTTRCATVRRKFAALSLSLSAWRGRARKLQRLKVAMMKVVATLKYRRRKTGQRQDRAARMSRVNKIAARHGGHRVVSMGNIVDARSVLTLSLEVAKVTGARTSDAELSIPTTERATSNRVKQRHQAHRDDFRRSHHRKSHRATSAESAVRRDLRGQPDRWGRRDLRESAAEGSSSVGCRLH
jgi:ACT domain-containing protein